MLDDQVIALARKTAAAQLRDLDEPLARAIGGLQAKMRGYGHLYLYIMERYEQEISRRAEIIWRNLHRAHNSKGATYSDDLRAALLKAFREDLDAQLSHLAPPFQKDMKDAPQSSKERTWNAKLGDTRDHELARYEAEIDHYGLSLQSAQGRGTKPEPTYVVHGNVGAIVSGAGSSVSVVQNIGAEQRDALLKALDLIRAEIKTAPHFIDRDRREFLELADDAATEVAKETPNAKRLHMALQSLAAAVQGVASGPAAYETLRAAAAAIGISL